MRFLVFILLSNFYVFCSDAQPPCFISLDIPLCEQTCRGKCISSELYYATIAFCEKFKETDKTFSVKNISTENISTENISTEKHLSEASLLQHIQELLGNTHPTLQPTLFIDALIDIYNFLSTINTCVWAMDLKCCIDVIANGRMDLLTVRRNDPYTTLSVLHGRIDLQNSPYIIDRVRHSQPDLLKKILEGRLLVEVATQTDPVSFSAGISEVSEDLYPSTVAPSRVSIEASSDEKSYCSEESRDTSLIAIETTPIMDSTPSESSTHPQELKIAESTRTSSQREKKQKNDFKNVPYSPGWKKRAVYPTQPNAKKTQPTTSLDQHKPSEVAKKIAQSGTEKTVSANPSRKKQEAASNDNTKAAEIAKTSKNTLNEIITKLASSHLEDKKELIEEAKKLLLSRNKKEIQEFITLVTPRLKSSNDISISMLLEIKKVNLGCVLEECRRSAEEAPQRFHESSSLAEKHYLNQLQAIIDKIEELKDFSFRERKEKSKMILEQIQSDLINSKSFFTNVKNSLELVIRNTVDYSQKEAEKKYLNTYSSLHRQFVSALTRTHAILEKYQHMK